MNVSIAVEVNRYEITYRIASACIGMKKPDHVTAKEAIEEMRVQEPVVVAQFEAAARSVFEYIAEMAKQGKTIQ